MTFISDNTIISGFSDVQKAEILAVIQTAYDGSGTVKTMFDIWIN
jgi:hypothetical protein